MKSKEIRSMDKESVNEKANDLKKELIKMKAQIAMGAAVKNSRQVRKIKKVLARIETIQHERSLKNQGGKK